MSHYEKLWKEGTLINIFTNNKYIDPNDRNAFQTFCTRHTKATEAPVVIAEMVQFEKRLNAKGIHSIFLFPGYGEISRFVKSRYGLMQDIPKFLTNSGKCVLNYILLKLIKTDYDIKTGTVNCSKDVEQ